jgi:hypothetical protein
MTLEMEQWHDIVQGIWSGFRAVARGHVGELITSVIMSTYVADRAAPSRSAACDISSLVVCSWQPERMQRAFPWPAPGGLRLLSLARGLEQTTRLHDVRKEPEQGGIGTEDGANQEEAQYRGLRLRTRGAWLLHDGLLWVPALIL